MLSHTRSAVSSELGSAPLATTDFELQSGPHPCPSQPHLLTAVYLARPRRTSASHQVRAHFAEASCPVMFDRYYHPRYNQEVRRKAFVGQKDSDADASSLSLQAHAPGRPLSLRLCALELPDPL